MFKNKACEILKTKELTFVNDWFQNERNAEAGHYRQALSISVSCMDTAQSLSNKYLPPK